MKRRTKYGWMELLIGVVLVLLGVFSFSHPESTLTGLVVVYGAVAVVTGIADIIFYVRIDRHIGFGSITSLIMGGISVMTGFNADSELPWDFFGNSYDYTSVLFHNIRGMDYRILSDTVRNQQHCNWCQQNGNIKLFFFSEVCRMILLWKNI